MRDVFVTGADGFAGGPLCEMLGQRGFRVTGVGLRPDVAPKNYAYHTLDIMDDDRLNTLLCDVRPEMVFHLAAISSTQIAERSLHHAARLNTLAVVNLMRFCAEVSPESTVVLFSTGEVYGPNRDLNSPHTEESPVAEPLNFYTATKIAQEAYAKILAKTLSLSLIILRLFSMTGPGPVSYTHLTLPTN